MQAPTKKIYTLKNAITNQQWLLVLTCVLVGLIPAGIFSVFTKPKVNLLLPNDPSINYPHLPDIVPSWALALVAIGCISIIIFVECFQLRKKPKPLMIWSSLYFFLEYVIANCLSLVFMLYFKNMVGRYRPDFLSRCQPDSQVLAEYNSVEAGVIPDIDRLCTNPDRHEVTDGMFSYPSGHSSVSFTCAVYLSAWIFWNFYIRKQKSTEKKRKNKYNNPTSHNVRRVFYLSELKNILIIFCIFAPVFIAYFIGASRIMQHIHNASDVNAGSALGIFISLFVMAKSGLTYDYYLGVYFKEQSPYYISKNVNGNAIDRDVESAKELTTTTHITSMTGEHVHITGDTIPLASTSHGESEKEEPLARISVCSNSFHV
eukprot:Pgem_evm1s20215